jgi:hypothetical protein
MAANQHMISPENSTGTGTCKARATTRLCWRAATGRTVIATNSASTRLVTINKQVILIRRRASVRST